MWAIVKPCHPDRTSTYMPRNAYSTCDMSVVVKGKRGITYRCKKSGARMSVRAFCLSPTILKHRIVGGILFLYD